MTLSKALIPPRKDKEEFFDWNDWTDYTWGWKTHGTPVFGSSFPNHQGLKKDFHLAAGSTSSKDELIEEEHGSYLKEDADRDGTTSDDGIHISFGDDAEQGAKSSDGNPDR